MNKRSGFIIVLAIVLAASSAFLYRTEAQSQFTDVSGRYAEAVSYIVEQRYAQGISETQFGTSRPIMRIDAAVMIARVLGFSPTDVKPASGFSDVPANRAWAVDALKDAGVVSGKTSVSYGSYETMTRNEMAKVIASAYGLKATSTQIPFTDVNQNFAPFVGALVEAGIANGKSATQFGAGDPITRGEFALFIYRADEGGMDLTPPEVISVD